MRFWQAMICAQMAAGATYADQFPNGTFRHHAYDLSSLLIGALMWWLFKRTLGSIPSPTTPKGEA